MNRRVVVALGLVAGACFARRAAADVGGIAIDRFEPSERGSDWFVGESLDLRGNFRVAVGAVGDFAYRPLVLYNPNGSVAANLVDNQDIVHLGVAVTFVDRVRVGINLPVAVFEDGQTLTTGGTTYQAPSGAALGDFRIGADVRLFGDTNSFLTMALGAQLFLPTGNQQDYMGDGTVRLEPRVLAAGRAGPFVYAAKLALDYRPTDGTLAGTQVGTEMLFSASAGVKVVSDRLVVGPEIFGSTVVSSSASAFASRDTPVEVIFGAHYALVSDVRVGAGVGPGLSQGDGAPAVRGLVSLEWAPAYVAPKPSDIDHDGVPDSEDACPNVFGERTSDPRTNGCPDRDHDGVADGEDACVSVPGVRTTDPATNGCPADRDHDGIADADDACPDEAGARRSDAKTNGCPDRDRDHDGIPDPEDACPDVPGVRTADPKTNGCPSDRDHDGIVDTLDACPDDPGPSDPDPKRNGCPKAIVRDGQIRILEQIKFRFGSADLDPESDPVLEAVRGAMRDHHEIAKIRVEGHTDNKGAPAYNLALSARRAESVVGWLVAHGIDRSRLTSEGFGRARPIVSNDTEQGRRENRRVEFHIVTVDSGATSGR